MHNLAGDLKPRRTSNTLALVLVQPLDVFENFFLFVYRLRGDEPEIDPVAAAVQAVEEAEANAFQEAD